MLRTLSLTLKKRYNEHWSLVLLLSLLSQQEGILSRSAGNRARTKEDESLHKEGSS